MFERFRRRKESNKESRQKKDERHGAIIGEFESMVIDHHNMIHERQIRDWSGSKRCQIKNESSDSMIISVVVPDNEAAELETLVNNMNEAFPGDVAAIIEQQETYNDTFGTRNLVILDIHLFKTLDKIRDALGDSSKHDENEGPATPGQK